MKLSKKDERNMKARAKRRNKKWRPIETVNIGPICQECFNELNSHGWCESCEKIMDQLDRDREVLDEESVKRIIETNRYDIPYNRKLDQFALYFLQKPVWTVPEIRNEGLEAETNIRTALLRLIKAGLIEKVRCQCGTNFIYRRLEKKCPDCDLMMPAWSFICGGCYDKKHRKIRKR